jgi:glycosyltransferase involved in cell wall biosynthesis
MTQEPGTVPSDKLRVLFVGAFMPPPDSPIRGGQLAACTAIVGSSLSNYVDWLLLESVMESIPPPSVRRRAWLALRRVVLFVFHLCTRRLHSVLIFTSGELSLVEKGLMAIIAQLFRKHVVLCPRSGFLIQEYRRSAVSRWWLRLVLRCSDRVVCQGKRWREFFASVSALPDSRFTVIYNFVSHQKFSDTPLPGSEVASRALLMGWVERNKGIFDLLEVAVRFQPELDGFRFVICGHGRDWEEFRRAIQERKVSDLFEMRGWVDDAGRLEAIAGTDICLMLSHHEGMPNSLLEAMAAGRPVVATSVGAVSDVVEEGINGYLCEPGDVDEIGFRILDLRRSRGQRVRFGTAACEKVSQTMAAEVGWRKWLEVLTPVPREGAKMERSR